MEIRTRHTTFVLSYSELRERYFHYRDCSDEEFQKDLAKIGHLSCIICWLKEYGPDATIGDKGLVHEIFHFLDGSFSNDNNYELKNLRRLFDNYCELA